MTMHAASLRSSGGGDVRHGPNVFVLLETSLSDESASSGVAFSLSVSRFGILDLLRATECGLRSVGEDWAQRCEEQKPLPPRKVTGTQTSAVHHPGFAVHDVEVPVAERCDGALSDSKGQTFSHSPNSKPDDGQGRRTRAKIR